MHELQGNSYPSTQATGKAFRSIDAKHHRHNFTKMVNYFERFQGIMKALIAIVCDRLVCALVFIRLFRQLLQAHILFKKLILTA